MRNRFTIFALALMLAVQAASPCLAMCASAAKQAPAQRAAMPHCHAAQSSPSTPADASIPAIKNPLPECCCINEGSAGTTGESAPATATANNSPLLFLAVDFLAPSASAFHAKTLSAPSDDASPPGAPLFISHRALLI
jgi:hypothetical protein